MSETVCICDAEGRHLVVLDVESLQVLRGQKRTVPGDCYCVRCSQPVPYLFNAGQPQACAYTHAGVKADGSVWCERCEISYPVASLLDREACPRCKLIL